MKENQLLYMLADHIQKVHQFRMAAFLPCRAFSQNDDENLKHITMTASEDKELYAAMNAFKSGDDPREIADALVDRVVFAIGWYLDGGDFRTMCNIYMASLIIADSYDINFSTSFEIVHDSNMSKIFAGAEEMAEIERERLATTFSLSVTKVEVAKDMWAFVVDDNTNADKEEFPIGKLLKPATYRKPDWDVQFLYSKSA